MKDTVRILANILRENNRKMVDKGGVFTYEDIAGNVLADLLEQGYELVKINYSWYNYDNYKTVHFEYGEEDNAGKT